MVEDESAIATLIETALGASGFRVTLCTGVRAAEQALDHGTVDLAILDLTLPDGPPDLLVERLTGLSVPLIAISGDPARLARFTAGQTLEKPFRIRALLDRIKALLPPV
nr:response regulator [Gluconacetobacter azotocaptans]